MSTPPTDSPPETTDSPPETERREVRETLHGDEIVDPYRWLESDDEAVAEWVAAQDDHAGAYLAALPATEALRPRMETLARTTDYGPVHPERGGYYQRVRAPEEDHSVLYRRATLDDSGPETADDDRHALVDPNAMSADGTTSVDWWSVSGDGALLAYGVAEGGDEQYDVRVADAETGEVVEEVADVGRTGGQQFAWAGDGFYYVSTGGVDGADAEGGQLDKRLLYHEVTAASGDDSDASDWTDAGDATDDAGDTTDDRVVREDIGPRTWPALAASRDGRHLVVAMQHGWERSDVYHLGPGDDDLQPLVTGTDAIFEPAVAGSTAYFRTSLDAPRYRVVACDLDAAAGGRESGDGAAAEGGASDGPTLREVVPEREGMLKGLALFDGGLVTHHQRDAVSELRVYDRDGHDRDGVGARGVVALPGLGTVDGLAGNRDAAEFCFRYQSFERPPTTARVDVGGPGSPDDSVESDSSHDTAEYDPEWLDAPDVAVDADLEVEQVWFESADGTEVPMFVVARSDVDRDGTAPAVLTGYGGFEISRTPAFLSFWTPFVEAGGVFALANLRGGGEYGEAWHDAGKRDRKQNTFDDFHAAADHLVDAGYAHPDRIACRGGSNGGLTVGAALTQRPDRFAAVLCQVPLLDMLRFHQFLLGESWATEYGSPDDPEAYEWLRAYSPYHNVEERAYPPTLFTTAEADTRVHPCHARKMAARLQHRTTADHDEAPVLLQTREQTGHGVGKPVSAVVDEQVEEWGFLFDQLGV